MGEQLTIPDLIDDALEILVVPSFSRIGYAVRRRLHGWARPAPGSLRGQTVLITGPTSGLGRASADALAALGARLILVGRDAQRLAVVRDALIAEHGEDRFRTVVADMSSLASVQAAATRILESELRLDVLIDNAGAIFSERTETADGLERTFATLVAGPFALISGLLPLLRRTGGARVVSVTSGGLYLQGLHLDDLQSERQPFDGTRAYAHAKRAQLALTRAWARRIPVSQVTFNAMHPGWADTPGISAALPGFYGLIGRILRTPAEGADTVVWLAADPAPAGMTGRLFLDRRSRPFDRLPFTRTSRPDQEHLWDVVAELSASGRDATTPAPLPMPTTDPRPNGATT